MGQPSQWQAHNLLERELWLADAHLTARCGMSNMAVTVEPTDWSDSDRRSAVAMGQKREACGQGGECISRLLKGV